MFNFIKTENKKKKHSKQTKAQQNFRDFFCETFSGERFKKKWSILRFVIMSRDIVVTTCILHSLLLTPLLIVSINDNSCCETMWLLNPDSVHIVLKTLHILIHLYALTMCLLSLFYCCVICTVASVEPTSDFLLLCPSSTCFFFSPGWEAESCRAATCEKGPTPWPSQLSHLR